MSDTIYIKSASEIEIMRKAAKIAAGARSMGRQAVRDGLTTRQIDRAVHEFIVKSGAKPSCLGYEGFPAATCVSVNEQVIHGIPGRRVVRNGDIVSIDLCATYKGFIGDCAGTYPCGEVSDEAKKLIEVTRQAFFEGLRFAKAGYRISDVGGAVQDWVEGHGFSVVRDFVGKDLMKMFHPDCLGGDTEMVKSVNRAYDRLLSECDQFGKRRRA